ncbi:hypothetical protein [Francisella salina]|uniref:Lipoprotein n=1 Tax=Francisella salina TaxID=573569 RepID=A0ABM5M799_FRAST|nr:hypothetical protein [Francisella salina]AEI35060.1 hypothetical protein F7308_0132 [Francisella salina]
MKKYLVIILSILLIGCSSNPKITEVGPGVIVSEKQLLTKEQIKKQDTKDDVLTGSGVGAGSGAVIGAGTGGLVGAGGSYIYASTKDVDKIKGKYQFEVLEDGKSSPITFEQFTDFEYASGDKVDIYQSEYKDVKIYFIKQLDQDSNEDAKIEKD